MLHYQFSPVQFSRSVMSNSLRPHESQHARPPCPSPSPGVHSLMSIESVMPSSHLILGRPLLLLPPIPPSIRVFSNESTLRIRWPKYWSFSFNINPSNKHQGLISFRIDWLDFLAVQRTLKSLTQHPQIETVDSSGSQSPSAVISEHRKIKSAMVSTFSPFICREVMGPDATILVLGMLSFKPTFSLSSFTFIKMLFSFSLLSAIRVVSSAYLGLLMFLWAILTPSCEASSLVLCMMYSTYKLNKQGDNILQP